MLTQEYPEMKKAVVQLLKLSKDESFKLEQEARADIEKLRAQLLEAGITPIR